MDFSVATVSNLPELTIGEESKNVLKDILRSKDSGNKGYVNIEELGDCLEAFGFDPDDEDLDFLKIHMDDNGDGRLEIEEVLDNLEVINYHCWYGKVLMDEFLAIDADKDNVIRFPEMLRALTTRGDLPALEARRLLDALARKFDANFDGKFSYPEFVKIYMSDLLPFKEQILQGTFKPQVRPATSKTDQKPKKKKILKKKPTESSLVTPNSAGSSRGGINQKDTKKTNGVTKSAKVTSHITSGSTYSPKPGSSSRPKTGSKSAQNAKPKTSNSYKT